MFLKTKHLEFDYNSSGVCEYLQKPVIIKVCYVAPWWAVKVLHMGSECFIAHSFGQIKKPNERHVTQVSLCKEGFSAAVFAVSL